MSNRFIIISLCLCAASALAMHSPQGRIIGGDEVQISSAPHLVSVRYKDSADASYAHRCSGTIYSSKVVLTTGTCVIGVSPQQLQVIAGSSYRTHIDGYVHLVAAIIIHPDYDIWFTNNDLALLQLSFPLIDSRPKLVAPIALVAALPAARSVASVAGWGAFAENADYTEQLQLAAVTLVPDAQCKQSYGEGRITSAMLCAGGVSAAGDSYIDACKGDAGSALVWQDQAVGLVSWGSGCGRENFPGVYTNLVFFKQWIEDEVAEL